MGYRQPSRKDWMTDANCAGNKEFLKEKPRTSSLEKICGACPVRYLCLNYAIANNELGYWAGTTERDRQEMRIHLPEGLVPIEDRKSFQKEPVRGQHSEANPLPKPPVRVMDLSFLDDLAQLVS